MNRVTPFVSGLLLALLAAPAVAQEGGQYTQAALGYEGITLTTSSRSALQHFFAGQHAVDMGRTEDARVHFEQSVAADPDFALAHLNLAFTSFAETGMEGVMKRLETASEKAARASDAERMMVQDAVLSLRGENDKRLETARKLADAHPSNTRALMMLASAQVSMGQVGESRRTVEKVTSMAPDFAPAHITLTNSYLFTEPLDFAKAREHAKALVRIAPDEAFSHDLLGDTYRAQGQLETAATHYGHVTERAPNEGGGYQQLGHVHSFLGHYDEARASYDRAIQLEKGKATEASFAGWRALVHVHEGDPAGAVRELRQLVSAIDGMDIPERDNQKLFALNNLITIALHHGMLEEARRAIGQRKPLLEKQAESVGTASARRNVRAQIALIDGMLAAREGDFEVAVQKAEKAKGILEAESGPDRYQPVHELLGIVSLEQKDYAGALEHFEQAGRDNLYANYHHALALEGAGRTAEAMRLYGKVANWNFNNAAVALVRSSARAKTEGLGG